MSKTFLKARGSLLPALALIACGTGIRLLLIVLGWPITDSDESTMGLVARHIVYQGEHPIFLYGQHYMGTVEAYLAAAFFPIFGPSVFSLRLGLLILYSGFLFSIYLLTCQLYSKAWALVTVGILSFGSSFMLLWQLSAYGGYAETLLFGSLSFLLASWLTLSYHPGLRLSPSRLLAYACYGVALGLGLWSDLLIAPFALLSLTLLLLFCWRELVHVLGISCLLLGLLVGSMPLIIYNLTAAPGQDSWSVFWQLHDYGQGPTTLPFMLQKIADTLQFSIPMMTGDALCLSTKEDHFYVLGTTPLCSLTRAFWGTGYLSLLALALALTLIALLHARQHTNIFKITSMYSHYPNDGYIRRVFVQHTARLLLLICAILTIFFYLTSSSPLAWSDNRARYLIGLLIVAPAIFFPLWQGLTSHTAKLARLRKSLCACALLYLTVTLILGTVFTFGSVSTDRAIARQQSDLINHLERLSITHIYTDYWTCDKIAFLSEEHITCEVINAYLQPSIEFSRYAPYIPAVNADPHAAYVFPPGMRIPFPTQKHFAQQNYQHSLIDDYVVYQPTT